MVPELLLLSQRKIANLAGYCVAYEFEDVFVSLVNAERVDTSDLASLEFSRRVYKLARLASGSAKLARGLAPEPRGKVLLEREYNLFFPVFSHAFELYSLATIPNWRARCRRAGCYIIELWPNLLPEYLLELLAEFDHIFIGQPHIVKEVGRITGRPCSYLPLGVDVLRFAPRRCDEPRPIKVCNLGRRSAVTHKALLEDADRMGWFYYYDTIAATGSDLKDRTFRVDSPEEHRKMLATLLKHSVYYIANRAYVNRPEFTTGREVISARFYEGAAAGAVLIGEAPRTQHFEQQFDWPDAVIHLPFEAPAVSGFLSELDRDPQRLRAARINNVRESALRHDWLYRIQAIFDTLALPPTDEMLARRKRLDRIAAAEPAGVHSD